tara:strand:- start:574 stop:1572 length:999 start_codon:yes stop_codon:yes gene_type:complete
LLKTFNKTEYDINDINNLINKELVAVNNLIEYSIGVDVPIIDDLSNHILSAGGKKIRPLITLLTCKLCNYQGKNHIALSACVELIHTATLLHDDVIDESKLRRGIPTANNIFGNKCSILVGDFLFSRSFELMVKHGSKSILKILSKTSSIIAEGEVMQLATIKDCSTNDKTYMKIIKAKTASLFSAASEISALLARKNNKIQNALKNYGENLGIAFQLVDDALDYVGNKSLGKKIGDDFKEGKITLPIIISIAKGNKEEKLFWKETLESNNYNKNDFKKALKIIRKYNAIEITLERAKQYSKKAINNLNIFPDSNYKTALESLAKISINRKN